MSYQIPQQLEYQEKIIFGLTFKQLIYLIIFLPIALAILFKTNLNYHLRFTLALIPVSLSLIFIFTDLPQKIIKIIKWLKMREFQGEKIKELLKLKEVKDGVIYLQNKKVAVLQIEPTNFDLKTKLEKNNLISLYQKFLNSLDFPVQIIVKTDPLNLDCYFAFSEERIDKKHSKIFYDFKNHLKLLTKEIITRNFYLIISEQDNLEIQIKICEEGLKNLNLKHYRVEHDLLVILSSFFKDVYQQPENNKEDYFNQTIAPKLIVNHKDKLNIDGSISAIIAIKGYPRTVEEGFLDKIITLPGNFDLVFHLEPYPFETTLIVLNKELQKQKADLWSMQNKSILNPSLEIKYKDTEQVLENLQKGKEKLFNLSFYLNCKTDSEEELMLLTKKLSAELNSLLIHPHFPDYQMNQGLVSCLPFAKDKLKLKKNITTKALSAFFPFTSQFLQLDQTGILLGLNKNNLPLIKDIFKLPNANGLILASSGSGKSYASKLIISRLLLNKTKVVIIDPQGEYLELVKQFEGQTITISKNSKTIINSLDLIGHDYDEKKLTLMDLLPIMIGEMSEIQKAVLDKNLTVIYKNKGINQQKYTWKREPPILADLLQQLKLMSRKATRFEKETYRSLINRLEMYVTGVFSFLNKQTNLDFNNQFVCFNIGEMPNQVKPVVMFLILDYVYMKMKLSKERKILVVDEAWSLLERTEDESYLFRIVKTCRKFNLGLLLITQDVEDLLTNKAGKALLNNSEYTILLRQKPAIVELVKNTFKLSLKEKERLITASMGEGILLIANEHSEIKIIASPREHKIITTNADELIKMNEIVTKFEKPTLDFSLGLFNKSKLKSFEVEELLNFGYQLSKQIDLYGGAYKEYLLKPRSNESCQHFFLVKKLEEYLSSKGKDVELYETRDADLVFVHKKSKIAIEVETGLRIRKNDPNIEKKVKSLKRKYKDKWFFVVFSKEHAEYYSQFGTTILKEEVRSYLNRICS